MVFVSLFGESVGIECGVWGAVFFFFVLSAWLSTILTGTVLTGSNLPPLARI